MNINESEIFEYNDLYINGKKLLSSITSIIKNFIQLYLNYFPNPPSLEEFDALK